MKTLSQLQILYEEESESVDEEFDDENECLAKAATCFKIFAGVNVREVRKVL